MFRKISAVWAKWHCKQGGRRLCPTSTYRKFYQSCNEAFKIRNIQLFHKSKKYGRATHSNQVRFLSYIMQANNFWCFILQHVALQVRTPGKYFVKKNKRFIWQTKLFQQSFNRSWVCFGANRETLNSKTLAWFEL